MCESLSLARNRSIGVHHTPRCTYIYIYIYIYISHDGLCICVITCVYACHIICVFITRSACTCCTLLSYICYRSNLSTKVCQPEVGQTTELERKRVACSTAGNALRSHTSSHTSSHSNTSHSTCVWSAQHSSLPKPLGRPTGWTGDHYPTWDGPAGTGWPIWHWHHGCRVRLWCPSREPCQCIPIRNAVLLYAAALLAAGPEDGHDASQHHARLQ